MDPIKKRKGRKPAIYPADVEMVSFPLSKQAQANLKNCLEELTASTGMKLSPMTLLEALFEKGSISAAADTLRPKIAQLQELEQKKKALGLHFLD